MKIYLIINGGKMKNLIILLILFVMFGISFINSAFSQDQRKNTLISIKQQVTFQRFIFENKISELKLPIIISKSDSLTDLKKDTTRKRAKDMSKSWWEPLLDLSFWSKLSGPGPFVGLGIDYPAYIFSKNFSLYAGISFSNSIDNTLQYYKTDSIRTIIIDSTLIDTTYIKYDSCISCEKSKAVQILLFKIEAQYHIPGSDFDVYAGGGFSTFFGETFKSFSRGSASFGASWRTLNYIQVGLLCNVFKNFNPSSFGAVNESEMKNTVEFVPGAFIKVSLF